MLSTSGAGEQGPPFQWPTSVFLYGPPGPLLNWVGWAFARMAPGGFRWSDVKLPGEPVDPLDPIARGVIPEDLLSSPEPLDLAPDHAAANAVISQTGMTDGDLAQLGRVSDFLRLPPTTRARIASTERAVAPLVLVVSNSHRLLPHYTSDSVRTALRTLIAHGVAIFGIFPAVAGEARFIFGNVWRLSASDPREWRETKLEVERAEARSPILPTGIRKLGDLPALAEALRTTLDPIL